MNFFNKVFSQISLSWNTFWDWSKPEFHNHYNIETHVDKEAFDEQNLRIEAIIRDNENLRLENKRLLIDLDKCQKRNRTLETTIDHYGTIFEIQLTYINDKDTRRRISAILTTIRENKNK